MGLLTTNLDVDMYDVQKWSLFMERSEYQKLKHAIYDLLVKLLDGHDNSFKVWFDVTTSVVLCGTTIYHFGYKVILDRVIKDVGWGGTVWCPADIDDILMSLFNQIVSNNWAYKGRNVYKFKEIKIL